MTYEEAIASIKSMFPSVDEGVIEAILDANSASLGRRHRSARGRPHASAHARHPHRALSALQAAPWSPLSSSCW